MKNYFNLKFRSRTILFPAFLICLRVSGSTNRATNAGKIKANKVYFQLRIEEFSG